VLKNLKKVFLMVAGAGVQKYGTELEQHQQLLLAVADILIEIYMAESALLRAEKNVNTYGLEAQEHQLAMSQLYLFEATEKITTKGREAILGFAEGDEQKALLMGLKRYTKYFEYPNLIALRKKVAEKLAAEKTYCF
jgi:predicted ATPase